MLEILITPYLRQICKDYFPALQAILAAAKERQGFIDICARNALPALLEGLLESHIEGDPDVFFSLYCKVLLPYELLKRGLRLFEGVNFQAFERVPHYRTEQVGPQFYDFIFSQPISNLEGFERTFHLDADKLQTDYIANNYG